VIDRKTVPLEARHGTRPIDTMSQSWWFAWDEGPVAVVGPRQKTPKRRKCEWSGLRIGPLANLRLLRLETTIALSTVLRALAPGEMERHR
jgi:hypothetical protein